MAKMDRRSTSQIQGINRISNVFDDRFSCISGKRFPFKERDSPYSTNGQCGPANGNLLCDPNSKVYTVS